MNGVPERVSRYTKHPTGGPADHPEPATIVVVPPGGDFQRGLQLGRELLRDSSVRVVAHGATVERVWPTWVRHETGLWFTELGAYRFRPALEATSTMRDALRSWTNAVFDGVIPGAKGSEVFYSNAATRFFQNALDARAIAEGLAAYHGHHRVECTDPSWDGWTQFRQLVAGRGATSGVLDRVRWLASMAAGGIGAWAGTVFLQTRNYVRSRASRARLARERSAAQATPPSLWVALVPDLVRINAHVIDSVAIPALRAREPLGVLLLESLGDGVRSEKDLRTIVGASTWGGLGPLAEPAVPHEMDQLVGAEDLATFVGDLGAGLTRSAAVVARLTVSAPFVADGFVRHPLLPHSRSIAKLATIEVTRAVLAARATERAIRRRSFREARVVFVSCGTSGMAAANSQLRRAGATTIDFVHGAGWDNSFGGAESDATVRCVWTLLDAGAFEPLGAKCVCIGMPRRASARPPPRSVKRVLIMSNYCHRDTRRGGRWPLASLQEELLEVPRVLSDAGAAYLQFRWRPHPSDGPAAIEETYRRVRGDVELSLEAPLKVDLEWCDIVVSSLSTALYEALFAGVPVFAHVPPELAGAPVYSFLAKERCFFYASDLPPRLLTCIQQIDGGDAAVLAPESRALRALFGPRGEPEPFSVERLRARERVSTEDHSGESRGF